MSELDVFLRIALAAGLGVAVCGLYLWSREPASRSHGLPPTILLLSPLIAMVTMAVGDNVAAAFTLVGTLAIVRFRTAIRDQRDTAFVIFAVACGLASGMFNVAVALIGTAVVGGVVAALRLLDEDEAAGESVHVLRVVLCPLDVDPAPLLAALARRGLRNELRDSKLDRAAGTVTLTYRVEGLSPDDVPALSAELLEWPELSAVHCRPARDEER